MDSPVVVLGLKNANALGLIRCLGEEGIPCIGINLSSEKEIAYYSRYLCKRFFSRTGYDEEWLLRLLIDGIGVSDALLIPTSDDMVVFMHKNKDELLGAGYIFDTCEDLMDLMNKDVMKDRAREAGFSVPRIFSVDSNDVLGHFPLMVKPRTSLGYSKDYLKVVNNHKELKSFLSGVEKREDFICEEFIPGNADDMYEVIAYRDNKGRTNVPCIIRKVRQSPPVKGSSSYIKTEYNDVLATMSMRFLGLIGYVGIADIEVKYNRRDRCFYFIEINYRPGGPIYLSKAAGANVPIGYYRGMLGYDVDPMVCRDNVTWMHDSSDWKNIGKSVSLTGFIGDVLRADSFSFYHRKDLKPFFYACLCKSVRMLRARRLWSVMFVD